MSGYVFTLPTTGAFFYSSSLKANDQESSLLSQASNHRAQLRDVLKTLKRSTEKDILSVIKTIEDYLPFLFTIYAAEWRGSEGSVERESINRLEEGLSTVVLLQHQKFVVDWRATFLDNIIPGKAFPRLDLDGIEYEVTFVLLTYAYALFNYAHIQSAASQKAVELLTKAAGVFAYQNASILSQDSANKPSKQCPELYPQFTACLTSMTMGQAQLCALRQLETKGSNAVLCRVAVGASDHFSTALGVLSAHPMLKSIPGNLRDHLVQSQKYAQARAYQYLGLEQQKLGQLGFAVGCAHLADALTPKDPIITTLLREWTKENQHVTFQQVSSKAEVQARLPSGRDFVKITSFVPPLEGQISRDRGESYAGSNGYY